MQLTDLLAQTGGLQSIARELGIDQAQAASGTEALLPALLGGIKKQAQTQPAGPGGLGDLFGQLGGGGLLDQVLSPQPTDPTQGNAVLGQLFGSKDVSRTVAQTASAQSGLDPSLLKRMLPLVAMLVTGYLARQGGPAGSQAESPETTGAGGGLGGMMGGLFGGGARGQAPGLGSLGGIGRMLDMNGDGNPLYDILRMAGKTLR
jgi:hypothetical protein